MSTGTDPARDWRTSSYSGTGNNCVQVTARRPGRIAVRDSKDPDGPALAFTPHAWTAFTRRAKRNGTSPA
jgi:hypothetical protein